MKRYKAIIQIREGILDNAGQAVTHALGTIGFDGVSNVRIGKILEFSIDSREKANQIAESQTNNVMETWELIELDEKD